MTIASRILLDIEAVSVNVETPFTLTSGKQSPVYVDCRKIISYPRERSIIIQLMIEKITNEIGLENIDIIAGGETAGIPYAAFIADRLNLPMIYIRKKPKGFGKNSQIEGTLRPGQRVLLVEDLMTDGGSKIEFINVLRNVGAVVNNTLVVFSYRNKENNPLADLKVNSLYLASWDDILAVGTQYNLTAENIVAVRNFLNQ